MPANPLANFRQTVSIELAVDVTGRRNDFDMPTRDLRFAIEEWVKDSLPYFLTGARVTANRGPSGARWDEGDQRPSPLAGGLTSHVKTVMAFLPEEDAS